MIFKITPIPKNNPDRTIERNSIIGEKFNKLTIISWKENKLNHNFYKCFCDCGKECIMRIDKLRSNRIKSCGCKRQEAKISHGMTNTRTYKSWETMKQRCNNPNHHKYPIYGGRGITVCKEWNESFEVFFNDMGERPENTTIDRINTNGNYCKDNCKWSTPKEQANNKRC